MLISHFKNTITLWRTHGDNDVLDVIVSKYSLILSEVVYILSVLYLLYDDFTANHSHPAGIGYCASAFRCKFDHIIS